MVRYSLRGVGDDFHAFLPVLNDDPGVRFVYPLPNDVR
jgi:hypothetical protein